MAGKAMKAPQTLPSPGLCTWRERKLVKSTEKRLAQSPSLGGLPRPSHSHGLHPAFRRRSVGEPQVTPGVRPGAQRAPGKVGCAAEEL